MVFPVHDHIVAQPDQSADDAEVRLKAGGKRHNLVLTQKCRQLLFQLQMQLQRSVQKPRARAARAEALIRLHTRADDVFVRRQPQIVVRAQHDPPLALHDDRHILLGLERMEIRINAARFCLVRNARFVALFK